MTRHFFPYIITLLIIHHIIDFMITGRFWIIVNIYNDTLELYE